MKMCDHKSVGMFVWKDGKLLMIYRAKPPFGVSVPAGHVDGDDSFEKAAIRELKEEVGLTAVGLEMISQGVKQNKCRRQNGDWHDWKLFNVEATGLVERSLDETLGVKWLDKAELMELGVRTEKYMRKGITEDDWVKDPGLEPVMYEWFKELKII